MHFLCTYLAHLKCIVQTQQNVSNGKTSTNSGDFFTNQNVLFAFDLSETIEMHFSVLFTIFVCQMHFLSSELCFQMHFFQTVQSDSFTSNSLLCILNAFWEHFMFVSFPDKMCCLQFNHASCPTACTRARTRACTEKENSHSTPCKMYFFLHGHFDLRTFENF